MSDATGYVTVVIIDVTVIGAHCRVPTLYLLRKIIFRANALQMCICNVHSLRSLTSPKGGCKWGVWGEGGEASGSPHSFTARNRFMVKGPLKGPGAT